MHIARRIRVYFTTGPRVTYWRPTGSWSISRRLNRLIMLAAIAVGGVSMSACYEGNQNGAAVGMVGDSITSLATDDLNTTLGADYRTDVQATPGDTMADLLPEIQHVMTVDPTGDTTDPPSDMVIEAGTNDVFQGTDWQASLDAEAQLLSSMQCVIFVNVSTAAGAPIGSPPNATAQALDDSMAAMVGAHSNFHLLDWNAWVNSGNNDATYIYPDAYGINVHETPDGEQQLADMVMSALATDCGS